MSSASDETSTDNGVVDEVKKMTTQIDDDRSRPLVCCVGDDLAGEGGIRPSRLFPRHRKNAGIPFVSLLASFLVFALTSRRLARGASCLLGRLPALTTTFGLNARPQRVH